VAFAATMRPDGAVGGRDDVSARDMHGMIWMVQQADMIRAQARQWRTVNHVRS
jgi:hypothetical protein